MNNIDFKKSITSYQSTKSNLEIIFFNRKFVMICEIQKKATSAFYDFSKFTNC